MSQSSDFSLVWAMIYAHVRAFSGALPSSESCTAAARAIVNAGFTQTDVALHDRVSNLEKWAHGAPAGAP